MLSCVFQQQQLPLARFIVEISELQQGWLLVSFSQPTVFVKCKFLCLYVAVFSLEFCNIIIIKNNVLVPSHT